MPPGPTVSRAEARRVVELLRADAVTAEGHVRRVTGLGEELPLLPADVVDRPTWASAAVAGMAALTSEARLPSVPATARKLTSATAGLQAGAVLSYLGSRVLGQYDPYGGAEGRGRLLLVAPNVVAAQQALDVPMNDFALWVCLHEATHRLQFTAVPWLRDYFSGEVTGFLSAAESTAAGILERLPGVISS
ncbi:MAG: zinc-dependent metalloprotease, partial [Pseudonocardia sp.]|nr:zinc-dependent metalloprotease [Pseudonocardia sp.]